MGDEPTQKSRYALGRVAADVAIVLAAFASTSLIAGTASSSAEATRLALSGGLFAGLVVAVYARLGLYRLRVSALNLLELRSALSGAILSGAIFLAVVLLTGLFDEDQRLLALATLTSASALLVERRVSAGLRAGKRWMTGGRKRTLVYGYNEAARLLMKKIVQAPEAGRDLVGFVDDFVAEGTEVPFRVDRFGSPPFIARLVGRTTDLVDLVREHDIAEILISSPEFESDALSRLEEAGKDLGVRWGIAVQFGSVRPDELVVEYVGSIPVLRPSTPPDRRAYLITKRVSDFLLALVGLVLTGPLWLAIAAAIRLESGSPVLFRQERVGKDGRRFVLQKFRSLHADTNPYQSSTTIGRDQATRVGRILRATGLDELPQLLNVLKGEMSLVGPRPEMPFLVEGYTEVQSRRLTVKPGITGVWQLSADRHGMEIHDNLEYDLFYIQRRSFILDLIILSETAWFAACSIVRIVRQGAASVGNDSYPTKHPSLSADGEYVLVALDQREESRLLHAWSSVPGSLPQEPFRVRVPVSDLNIEMLRTALEENPNWGATRRVQFVPNRSAGTLRQLTQDAALVVTNIECVSRLAKAAGIKVLELKTIPTVRGADGDVLQPVDSRK